MSDSQKATRATIAIGALAVEGFMLPDGSYRMSQTQVAEAVGLSERNARDFLRSKAVKSLLGEGYTPAISEVEIENSEKARGQSRINALPLEVVSAYWQWQSYRGNKQALALCMALMTETIERRFDAAFGIQRSEQEYNKRLEQRVQQLEQQAGEAFADADNWRRDRDYLLKLLADRGVDDPWSLPADPAEE